MPPCLLVEYREKKADSYRFAIIFAIWVSRLIYSICKIVSSVHEYVITVISNL